MAGWDGDALAGQMEDEMERADQVAEMRKLRRETKSGDRAKTEKMESLRLSLVRVTEQLNRAQNPAHREMLERAIASIEREQSEL
jgi:hypothetical protein